MPEVSPACEKAFSDWWVGVAPFLPATRDAAREAFCTGWDAGREHGARLDQVPAGDVCPAEVTTFLGLKLECERTGPHRMHFDIDQGIWWAHGDETDGADPVAAERTRILAAAREASFTLFRPGFGRGEAHGRAMEVVPLEALVALLGGAR